MEKALGNVLRVITFVPEGVQKNEFLHLFSNRKKDVAKYLAIRFVKYDKEGNKQDTIGFFTSRCVIKFPREDMDMLNASID